jgi:hypothetical protein
VIAIRDDHSAALPIAYQEKRRKLAASRDLAPIPLDVRVADPQKRESRRTEDVRLEFPEASAP